MCKKAMRTFICSRSIPSSIDSTLLNIVAETDWLTLEQLGKYFWNAC